MTGCRRGFDVDAITTQTDSRTRIIVINAPHDPTGATTVGDTMRAPHDFARARNVQLVVDEVFHRCRGSARGL